MNENKIRCPKCLHEQNEQNECEACGLIFARYNLVQQRQREQEENLQAGQEQRKKTIGSLLQIALLVLLTASITYSFSRGKSGTGEAESNALETKLAETKQLTPPADMSSAQPPRPVDLGKTPARSPVNPLEHARNATVSIETPWGVGSGFFVKENSIITNKHVVELNKEELEKFRDQVKTGQELIRLEKEKIRDMYQQMNRLPEGPSKRQLAILIARFEEELAKNIPQFEKAEERLENLDRGIQPRDIKIIMADGSETTANYIVVSQNHDLAMLSLYSNVTSFLQKPVSSRAMQQGDKVYTIGSPSGLRNTVTAGIFSGYRKRDSDGALLLQTDAAINPGNSGGPLIDVNGYVHGVNTMILQDTEGIGFAISIETVYEEFRLTF